MLMVNLHAKTPWGLNKVKCWMTEEELKEEEALLNEEEILWELDGIAKCWIEKSIFKVADLSHVHFRKQTIRHRWCFYGSKYWIYWFPGFGFDSGPNLQPWCWLFFLVCFFFFGWILFCLINLAIFQGASSKLTGVFHQRLTFQAINDQVSMWDIRILNRKISLNIIVLLRLGFAFTNCIFHDVCWGCGLQDCLFHPPKDRVVFGVILLGRCIVFKQVAIPLRLDLPTVLQSKVQVHGCP